MCCFLLHDILKMKFEGLNLMCCCAKPNKYYQFICKIGSVKFDRGGAPFNNTYHFVRKITTKLNNENWFSFFSSNTSWS